jgi:hypothetical protein
MTSTAPRPTAARKPLSATHIADELSVLKADASINEAVENMHSDDPGLQASGQAQLQALVDTESDLRDACNGIIWSAHRDDEFAAGLKGQIDYLLETVAKLKAQQTRHTRRATRKRVYACSLLNHHFPDEKTHPTPLGNIGTLYAKPSVTSSDGSKLRISDIPEDYEWLISVQEKTTKSKVIDEQKILDGLAKGESFGFARLKENSTRFF